MTEKRSGRAKDKPERGEADGTLPSSADRDGRDAPNRRDAMSDGALPGAAYEPGTGTVDGPSVEVVDGWATALEPLQDGQGFNATEPALSQGAASSFANKLRTALARRGVFVRTEARIVTKGAGEDSPHVWRLIKVPAIKYQYAVTEANRDAAVEAALAAAGSPRYLNPATGKMAKGSGQA